LKRPDAPPKDGENGEEFTGTLKSGVMTERLTPYYIDLIYEATLKSFWRRKALGRFLRQCGISEAFLAGWLSDESKRDILDRLFTKLPTTDTGRAALLRMARLLMEQRSFPDLEKWEDSPEKIKEAHDAVSRLRIQHDKQDEVLQSEEASRRAREEFKRKQAEITRSQKSLQGLSDRLNNLGQELGTAKAGYDFQNWFYDLVDFSEIPNRKPYAHSGRQIDGSLTVSGTTYLVELKFTSEQVGAPDIDTFYKKVTTKADNTMGIMVSISGYSGVAIKEASGDRTPLLLMDHGHIYLVLGGVMGFVDVIERVRRHASQTGEAYLPVNDFAGK
jgi:hypothetical protein